VRDGSGVRLAKRHNALSIRQLRESGATADQVIRRACLANLGTFSRP
jgi:hypothetical protein